MNASGSRNPVRRRNKKRDHHGGTSPPHGTYHQQTEDVADIKKTYQWLERAGLRDSTEAVIMAAREQVLNTRLIEVGVYHTRHDQRSRLRKGVPQTVQHITAGCKILAGKAYLDCHSQVAGIVYRNFCVCAIGSRI